VTRRRKRRERRKVLSPYCFVASFLMHRVSSASKENSRKEVEDGRFQQGGVTGTNWQQPAAKAGNNTHSSNNKNENIQLRFSWDHQQRSQHKACLPMTMFLLVFTLCLMLIPELLDPDLSLQTQRHATCLLAGSSIPPMMREEQQQHKFPADLINSTSRNSALEEELTHEEGAVRGARGSWASSTGVVQDDHVQSKDIVLPSGKNFHSPTLSNFAQISFPQGLQNIVDRSWFAVL
jgi:hypothetical protein